MTRAFQVLIEGTAEAAEALGKGMGTAAADATAEAGAAEAGATATAAAAGTGGKEALAAAAKAGGSKGKSLFSKGVGYAKSHPKKALLGAGIAGVTTAALLGDDDHQPIKGINNLLDKAGLPTLDDIAGTGHGTGTGTGTGTGHGEIEIDTEELAAFAVELRRAADSLHSAPGEMKSVIEHLVQHYSTDGSGTPTRDGGPMPCAKETVKALTALGHHYDQVVSGIISQLTHDAAAIDELCQTHDDSEHEHANKFNNIDTNLTME